MKWKNESNECKEPEVLDISLFALKVFKSNMERIRVEEVNRFLKKSKSKVVDVQLIERLTKSMINSVISIPVLKLNTTVENCDVESNQLSVALLKLFESEH